MNSEKYAILPCNGLDKALGQMAREIALKIQEKNPEIEIICPVLLSRDSDKYKEAIEDKQWIIIDGCGTRCATKLAAEKAGRVKDKIYVPDVLKERSIKIGKSLYVDEEGQKTADLVADDVINKLAEAQSQIIEIQPDEWEHPDISYLETMIDKFVLRVPKVGYLFNENDCWAEVRGNRARLGITDYLQSNAGDIMFVNLPEIGTEITQFGDIAEFESAKAILQIVSPVSGKVTAVNETLRDKPELLNEDPYVEGWIIEVELTDLNEDMELLIDGEKYFEVMTKKAKEEIAGRH